jgi:hypothetical protein
MKQTLKDSSIPVNREKFEVADIFRLYGQGYICYLLEKKHNLSVKTFPFFVSLCY